MILFLCFDSPALTMADLIGIYAPLAPSSPVAVIFFEILQKPQLYSCYQQRNGGENKREIEITQETHLANAFAAE